MRRFVLLIVLLFSIIYQANADSFEIEDLEYKILSESDRTVEVKLKHYFDHDLEIPTKVVYKSKTYNVVKIANNGFNNNWFKSVVIPEGITTIGKEAFKNCI